MVVEFMLAKLHCLYARGNKRRTAGGTPSFLCGRVGDPLLIVRLAEERPHDDEIADGEKTAIVTATFLKLRLA